MTYLIKIVLNNNIDLLQKYIWSDLNLNTQDESGDTGLIIACRCDYIEIALLLIESGCDLDIQNKLQQTALMISSCKNSIKIVKKLIEKKCKLDIKNNLGDTALILACRWDNIEIAKLLIESECDLNIKNNIDKTYLDYINSDDMETLNESVKLRSKRNTLFYQCIKYVREFRNKFKNSKLKMLNRDIRKYFTYEERYRNNSHWNKNWNKILDGTNIRIVSNE